MDTTSPNCLKLLPNDYKKQQKVYIHFGYSWIELSSYLNFLMGTVRLWLVIWTVIYKCSPLRNPKLKFISKIMLESEFVVSSWAVHQVNKKLYNIQLNLARNLIIGTAADKMFVASENIIKGFNRKGKMFLSFDTNLTEPIKCMSVWNYMENI